MIILTGPSGSGKTETQKALVDNDHCEDVVTATSRSKRRDEQDGIHYHFFNKKQFKVLINRGLFVEHVKIAGDYYGLPKAAIAEPTELPQVAVLDLEGANYLKNTRKGVFVVHLDIQNSAICPKRKSRDAKVDWSELASDYTISSFDDIDINRIMTKYYAKRA